MDKAHLNLMKFTLYCSDHSDEFFERYPELKVDPWICQVCNKNEKDYDVILCDDCDKGWHTFCLNPHLNEIPKGDWFCDNCMLKEFNNC